ncbi:hypothetical protein [Microvirga mediterraneensis]|uniref:Uncharacterized protein n=1 Tax=Microvirga mediterraneensis TaxID=2754695 RepID=A0A838BP65_9HYPH|nr:hypothetical protein [Microvirga mediterraneensis]MBA1157190.1 hypothetical protein [Microvirga mediterraneensis]
MQRHLIVSVILAGTAGLILAHPTPASALTMKECSAKYKAAQTAGTLGTTSWNDFRKAQCGSTASTSPAAVSPSAPATTGAVAPQGQTNPSTARPAAPMTRGNVVFPTSVSSKYSTESAGKARMHTCLDQYKANEAGGGNGNGGLKWIEKGGGYYSQCNTRLKGG